MTLGTGILGTGMGTSIPTLLIMGMITAAIAMLKAMIMDIATALITLLATPTRGHLEQSRFWPRSLR